MEYRDEVNASEERLLKVLGPVSNVAQYLKRIRHPEYALTLGQILEICNDKSASVHNIEKLLNRVC